MYHLKCKYADRGLNILVYTRYYQCKQTARKSVSIFPVKHIKLISPLIFK